MNDDERICLELNLVRLFCKTPPTVVPQEFKTTAGRFLIKTLREHWDQHKVPISPDDLFLSTPPFDCPPDLIGYFLNGMTPIDSLLPQFVKKLRSSK